MLEANGECDLLVFALVNRDTGGVTAERVAPVGADDERRVQRIAALERHGHGVVARRDAEHFVLDQAQVGERAGALLERRDQMTILDVVAERLEIDLVGRELHLRCAPQPSGVVDDAHHPHRRRLRLAQFPHAEG